MAIIVNQSPPDVSFSLNRIIYELQGNDIVQIAGVLAVNTITFTSAVAEGNTISLRYNGREVRFVAAAVPDASGNQIPVSATPDASYVASLIPYFQNNFYLDPDYTVTSSGTTLILTAKKKGAAYNLRTGPHQSGAIAQTTAGVDEKRKKNFAIYVEVNLVNDDASLTKIYGQPYETDKEGVAQVDISKILHAHLEADLPPTNGDKIQKCTLSNRKYALRVAEASGNPFNIGILSQLPTKRVILGGTPYEEGPGQTPISVTQGTTAATDTALRLGELVRDTRLDQPQYLTFLNSRASTAENLRLVLNLYFSDNSSEAIALVGLAGIGQNDTVQFAAGFNDLNLSSYETSLKIIERYTLQLTTIANVTRSDIYTFNVDREFKPYARHFIYVNSLGALETVLTYGKGSETWSFIKKSAERYLAENYKLTDGQSSDYDLQADVKFEVASGWLRSKREVRQFADMFLSRWKYSRHNGVDLPVTVNTKEIKLAPDGDGRHAVGFEYQYRFNTNLLSTDSLDGDWFELIPPPLAGGGANTTWAWEVENNNETDLPDWVINITQLNITNWNTAFSWGNHASAGYLTTADAALLYAPAEALTEALENVYMKRELINTPIDFLATTKNGSYRIDAESWAGFDYPPANCIPHGQFDVFTNGPDMRLEFTDDDGFLAELRKINGVWDIDEENNPGGWRYPTSAQLPEFDEEGNQLGLSAVINRGKMFDFSQFIIRKGDRFMGLLPASSVLSGVPKLDEGQHVASINGSYIYYIEDWKSVTDGPENLSGKGFLRISYYNGIVHFQAYSSENGETTMAHATIPAQGEEMTKWRIDTDVFATIEQLNNRLELYALKNHIHDDRYYIKAEIEAIVAQYKLAEWLPEIADVKGLAITLLNKLDVSLFQNSVSGETIILGNDGVPVAADLNRPFTTTISLPGAKEGVAYSAVIEDVSLVWQRGAYNKRIIATPSERWVNFTGAIVGGSGSNIGVAGTPNNSKTVIISLDFVCNIADGSEIRQQRIVFLNVEPAAATITAPAAPTSLSATAISKSQINLVWVDNANNETGQEMERSTAADFSTSVKLGGLGPNITTYQDKVGLLPSTLYYYRVRAVNSEDESAWSTASATTMAADAAPTSGLWANYYDTTYINALGTADEGRVDTVINFDLTADAPSEDVTPGAYIARWSGFVKTPVSGNFQFNFDANAKFRIYFGGVLVVDSWALTTLRSVGFSRAMTADVQVPILIEYLQTNADTFARLGYTNGNVNDVVPTAWLVPLEVAPLAAPVLSAANVDSDTIRLSWTLTTDPDSFEVFGGVVDNANNNSILPLLTNVTPAASARTIDVNGLPAGTTFVFEMRSKKNGVYSELSNRATASTPNAADVPNSAAPVILVRPALSTNTLVTQFTDNNTGDTELYSFRFKQVGTGTWYYRTISGGLSTNEADAYASTYPAGSTRELNFSNDFFAGKLIRVEVRVTKDGLLSPWAGSEETETAGENRAYEIIEMDKFRPRKATNGLWYDSEAETDNSVFHNFYFAEDRKELFFNADGTPKPFVDISIPGNSIIMLRKLRVRKSTFPNIQKFEEFGYLANLNGGDINNIQYNAQAIIRTFDEAYIPPTTPPTTPPVVTPPPPPPVTLTRAQVINYNQAIVFPIVLYTMSYSSWKIDHIKALALSAKNLGFKAIQLSFSPYKVWNNYTSAGAFNADALTWDWTNINTLINYICNDLGLWLIVRLHPDISDFSITTYAANADTPDLASAWGGHFEKKAGSIKGLKIDNLNAPPWMLFRRFCAAFKQQYNTYWTTGKILVWEFATNDNQEAQINPDTDNITYPTFGDYITRTEQMYDMGQLMLSIMSGWEDNQWNVGSWVNEGAQLKGNTMGYSRFTQGFKGMRGNHGSDWSLDHRNFHDILLYTRKQKAAGRYYSVEYFRKDLLSTAPALAGAMKSSINNGAWLTGYVYDVNLQDAQNFMAEMAGNLNGYFARPLASPLVTPVDYDFSISNVYYEPYFTGPDGMFAEYMKNKNAGNIPQYMAIEY